MNSDRKDIIVASINDLRLKGSKYLVVGYTNKTSVEIMYWLYIFYGKITPDELMKNQYTMQSSYHVEEPIEILFDQIKTGKEFEIAGNYPLTDRRLSDMGISQILATQEYTHAYHM